MNIHARVIISLVLHTGDLWEAALKRVCRRFGGRLIVLALLFLGCGCTVDEDQSPLFRDEFDNEDSGWSTDRSAAFECGYDEGEYFVRLHEPGWFTWAYPGEQFDDASVEVDAYLASGSQDNHFGVLCRHMDVDNFYYFAISADGYYAIFRRAGSGDLDILTGDGSGMISSSAIRMGERTNHVAAVCSGDELSLYVNGELLETVTDDTHTRGNVGIGAGSGPERDVHIRFDNFVVTNP